MNTDVSARLDLVAAQARVLAQEYKDGRLWPGDLLEGLDNISKQIERVRQALIHDPNT